MMLRKEKLIMQDNVNILGPRILVAPDEFKREGIQLPETAQRKEKPTMGTIVEVGDEANPAIVDGGVKFHILKPGDRVIIPKYGGVEMQLNGKRLLFFMRRDLFGIFKAGADLEK